MTVLTIRKYPDAVLRNKAKSVTKITEEERKFLKDMAETMYANQGVGLAATQVGIDKQLIVIDVGEGLVELVNPAILKKVGCAYMEEGCLSVPGVEVKVKRAERLTVQCMREDGGLVTFEATGLFARAVQHEIDHLCGRLIIDHLNPIKRLFVTKRVSRDSKKRDKKELTKQ